MSCGTTYFDFSSLLRCHFWLWNIRVLKHHKINWLWEIWTKKKFSQYEAAVLRESIREKFKSMCIEKTVWKKHIVNFTMHQNHLSLLMLLPHFLVNSYPVIGTGKRDSHTSVLFHYK